MIAFLFWRSFKVGNANILSRCVSDGELATIQSGSREEEWKSYQTPSGFSFRYPEDRLDLNILNADDKGIGMYDLSLPSRGSWDRLVTIEINEELPDGDGWSDVSVYNNQNPLLKQLEYFFKNNRSFHYTPCHGSDDRKTVVETDDGIVLLFKKEGRYLKAYGDLKSLPEYADDIKAVLGSIE